MTFAIAAIAAIWIVPAMAVRPVTDPAALAFPVGLAAGLSLVLVRRLCNARDSRRLSGASGRFLTASTWAVPRTIDMRDLKRIRARRVDGRLGSVTYLVVTDAG